MHLIIIFSKTEFVVKNILILTGLFLLFSFNAFAGQKLVYKFKKALVASGELIYEIEKSTNNSESFYTLKTSTKINVFGRLVKSLNHVSINNEDLTPIKNTYCQSPRPKNGDNSCASLNFNSDGSFLFQGYEAKKPVIRELSLNDSNVKEMNMLDNFSNFTPYADQVHDIASFFLYPSLFPLTENDSGKKFYLSILYLKGEMILEVKRLNSTTLKLIFKAGKGTDSKISEYVPKHAIFDEKQKVITTLVLRTKYGEVKVKLDRKRSRL